MAARLIIDGNAVYEIDEDCLECQKKSALPKRMRRQDCGCGREEEADAWAPAPEQEPGGAR